MSDLFWLSDAQMARLKPYFPKSHGKPRVDDRRVLSGIIFINRNGLRWRDAPREYGPHKTLYNRWKRWSDKGIFAQMMVGLAANHGVNVIHDWAVGVDGAAKTVELGSGDKVSYDRLVISPGIDLKYGSVPGYSVENQDTMPHAWKSGTQVALLKAQVEAMREGGTFVMVPPPNPIPAQPLLRPPAYSVEPPY